MKDRILVVSWFYPPVNTAEAICAYKQLKNSSFEYDIITQTQNFSWSYGNFTSLPELENVNVISIEAGSCKDFISPAVKYFKENIDNYDVVITRSMPPESHEIGLEIKRLKPSIFWIASLNDPIANNPYTLRKIKYPNKYSLSTKAGGCFSLKRVISVKRFFESAIFQLKRIKLRLLLAKEVKLQRNILEKCDYLVCNNEYQLRRFEESFNGKGLSEKTLIVPHSYDPDFYYSAEQKRENEKIIFTYFGHADQIRTPFQLFCAIKELRDDYPDLASRVCFNFYGNIDMCDVNYISEQNLRDMIFIHGGLEYKESLKTMQSSDWLIHLDANLYDVVPENIFFASKLTDYMGSGAQIFGITMLNGIGADILREANAVCSSHSVQDIRNYLYMIIFKGFTKKLDENYISQYNASLCSKKIDERISNALTENNCS